MCAQVNSVTTISRKYLTQIVRRTLDIHTAVGYQTTTLIGLLFRAIVRVDDRCVPAVRSSISSRPVPFARYKMASPPEGNDFESNNKSNAFTNRFLFAISIGA